MSLEHDPAKLLLSPPTTLQSQIPSHSMSARHYYYCPAGKSPPGKPSAAKPSTNQVPQDTALTLQISQYRVFIRHTVGYNTPPFTTTTTTTPAPKRGLGATPSYQQTEPYHTRKEKNYSPEVKRSLQRTTPNPHPLTLLFLHRSNNSGKNSIWPICLRPPFHALDFPRQHRHPCMREKSNDIHHQHTPSQAISHALTARWTTGSNTPTLRKRPRGPPPPPWASL